MMGHIWPKEKPLRVSCSRKSTPTVMTTAGPIKLRIVQRRQVQRIRSLIGFDLYEIIPHKNFLRAFQNISSSVYGRRPRRLRNISTPTPIRIKGQKRSIL
jgi:hypothetical protein